MSRRPITADQCCNGECQQGRSCPIVLAQQTEHQKQYDRPSPTRRDRLGLFALTAWSIVAWIGLCALVDYAGRMQ